MSLTNTGLGSRPGQAGATLLRVGRNWRATTPIGGSSPSNTNRTSHGLCHVANAVLAIPDQGCYWVRRRTGVCKAQLGAELPGEAEAPCSM